MQVSVTSRHVPVSDSIREYAEKKANKLVKYYDRIQAIEVVLDRESVQHIAEMIVSTDGQTHVASERGQDPYAAVDLVVDKMERQLTRRKEKFRNRKHLVRKPPADGSA